MQYSRRFAFALLAGLALVAAGCGSNSKKMVGKWKIVAAGGEQVKMDDKSYAYFEFRADGTASFGFETSDPEAKKFFGDMGGGFKWKVTGDKFEFSDASQAKGESPFGKKEKATGKLKFEGDDKVILTPDDEKDKDKPLTLTRMK